MTVLTREEWMRTAEYAAAAKWGEKHSGWFSFRRFGLPLAGIAIGLGGLGFVAYHIWTAMSGAFSGEGAGIPVAFWVVAGLLLIGTLIAFRPGRLPSSSLTGFLVKLGAVVIAWLALIGYGIALIS